MRTTLDIEDDVLEAARELARHQGMSVGQMVSRLLRAALRGTSFPEPSQDGAGAALAGFRPFPAPPDQLVTNDQIDRLRDEAGL